MTPGVATCDRQRPEAIVTSFNISNSWYLIQTSPARERFAEHALREWCDCEVYLPLIQVERIRRHQLEQVFLPFFPRYAFVADDGRGTHHIRNAPGVTSVVGTPEAPSRVSQQVIDAVKDQEQRGVVQAWQPGQPVKVNGLDAVFKERDGRQRAVILIRMFAMEHETVVPVGQLEAVN